MQKEYNIIILILLAMLHITHEFKKLLLGFIFLFFEVYLIYYMVNDNRKLYGKNFKKCLRLFVYFLNITLAK